jgi:hypothetical protein
MEQEAHRRGCWPRRIAIIRDHEHREFRELMLHFENVELGARPSCADEHLDDQCGRNIFLAGDGNSDCVAGLGWVYHQTFSLREDPPV